MYPAKADCTSFQIMRPLFNNRVIAFPPSSLPLPLFSSLPFPPPFFSPKSCDFLFSRGVVWFRCVLYEMTCLRNPFDGTNMRLLVMKICSKEPRPISAR